LTASRISLRALAATATMALVLSPAAAFAAQPETSAVAPLPGDVPVALQSDILAQENRSILAQETSSLFAPKRLQPSFMAVSAATTGNRRLCRNISVRHSDRARLVGYAQAGDIMNVERYSQFRNASAAYSWWAVGTVRTQAGALYGYVLYDGGTFC
jgi:hypothetical protein